MPDGDQAIARVEIDPASVSFHTFRAVALTGGVVLLNVAVSSALARDWRDAVFAALAGTGLAFLYVLSGLPLVRKLLSTAGDP